MIADPTTRPAPADAQPHRPWRWPARLAAYAILLVLAIVSIWFIDRRVDALAEPTARHAAP